MKKIIAGVTLALALIAFAVVPAFAQEDTGTPVVGTVQDVTLQTDATTGVTTVDVTVLDDQGGPSTVNISLGTATSLGLVTTDLVTGETTVAPDAIGKSVPIDPASILSSPTATDENQHPVAATLAEFFSDTLGVDYDTIIGAHEDGAGFGVIAQALWMTNKMEGDSTLFQTIIDAKLSGDYSSITLEDGSHPANWGQFRKAILKGEAQNNLGDIMSGRADSETTDEHNTVQGADTTNTHGHGNANKGRHNGHGHGNHGP